MATMTEAPWTLAARPGETPTALRTRRDLAYFAWQQNDNAEFWRRLDTPNLSLANTRVLDLGCGHGALAVDAAAKGAAHVHGIDLDEDRIAFARTHIPDAFPTLAPRLTFGSDDLATLPPASIDIVLCKDTMEHIIELETVAAAVHRLLRPGGTFVIGTSPLYYSPFGDHGRYLGPGLPWLPVLLPEPILFRLASRKNARPIHSAADVGLNKMTPARFRSLFNPTLWSITTLRYNAGSKPLLTALNLLRRIPPFEPLATVSIYATIERR